MIKQMFRTVLSGYWGFQKFFLDSLVNELQYLKIHDLTERSLSICGISECVEALLQCDDGPRPLLNGFPNYSVRLVDCKKLHNEQPEHCLTHTSISYHTIVLTPLPNRWQISNLRTTCLSISSEAATFSPILFANYKTQNWKSDDYFLSYQMKPNTNYLDKSLSIGSKRLKSAVLRSQRLIFGALKTVFWSGASRNRHSQFPYCTG